MWTLTSFFCNIFLTSETISHFRLCYKFVSLLFFVETFPRLLLHNPEWPSDRLPGLCHHQVGVGQVCCRVSISCFQWDFLSVSNGYACCTSHPQPLPLGPLWRFALHERDGGLRWANLHDPPHQGHLPHSAGRLPQDHGRQERRDQLLHIADDQGLHEESGAFEPPPDCSGAKNSHTSSPQQPLVPPDWPINLFLSRYRQVDDELEIKAYYAGHVLGAAMVHIKVGSESVVYTVSANKPALRRSLMDFTPCPTTMLLFLLGRL